MNANVCSPNSGIISGNRPRPLSFCALKFAADRWLLIAAISSVVLLPCFWHQHIEAGDLASHTYNAWLAQLIARGDAPGLYLVRQWNNVLVDVALAKLGGSVGFAAADKIVVSACVLIFFWGAFAFIAAATWRPPWFLIPAVAMIAYGWTFQMGFMNYYLSLGFAFFATALFWRGQAVDWLAAFVLSGLTLMAHPMGFCSLVAMVVYIQLAEKGSGWYRWKVFASALLAVLALHWYIVRHFRVAYWDTAFFYLLNGADQLILYGNRYLIPTWIALIFGSVCFIHGRVQQRKRTGVVIPHRAGIVGDPSFRGGDDSGTDLLAVVCRADRISSRAIDCGDRNSRPVHSRIGPTPQLAPYWSWRVRGYFFLVPVRRHRHAKQNGRSGQRDDEDFALRTSRDRNHRCAAGFAGPIHQSHRGSCLYWTMFHVFQLRACLGAVSDSCATGQPCSHRLGRFRSSHGRRQVCGSSARPAHDADRAVRRERSNAALHARSFRW
jgi:hypothetical protein